MLPVKASSSSVYGSYVASYVIDGDVSTYQATEIYMPKDAWIRVFFVTKVI